MKYKTINGKIYEVDVYFKPKKGFENYPEDGSELDSPYEVHVLAPDEQLAFAAAVDLWQESCKGQVFEYEISNVSMQRKQGGLIDAR